jgi:hypothetical protein
MGEKLHFQPEFRSLNGGAAAWHPITPRAPAPIASAEPSADRSASEILWKMLMPAANAPLGYWWAGDWVFKKMNSREVFLVDRLISITIRPPGEVGFGA